jgi:hypothetical protein
MSLQVLRCALLVNRSRYTVPCKDVASLPNITVTLGGKDFVLTPDDYIIKDENVICLFGMTGIDIPAPEGPVRFTIS